MTLVWSRDIGGVPIKPRLRSVWMTSNIDIFLYNRQNIQEKVEEALSKSLLAGCHDEKDYNNIFQSFAKLSKSFPLSKKSKFWRSKQGNIGLKPLKDKKPLLRPNQGIWCIENAT